MRNPAIARLAPHGNGLAVYIPRPFQRRLSWRAGQYVMVSLSGQTVQIEAIQRLVPASPAGASVGKGE